MPERFWSEAVNSLPCHKPALSSLPPQEDVI
jgi:hypothetical protein